MTESKKNLDLTANDLVDVYNTIYLKSVKPLQHPTKDKKIPPYGSYTKRGNWYLDFLKDNVTAGSTVLDASCGRGWLLRFLLDFGYKAEGTECAPTLFDQELKSLPARLLRYDQLKEHFGENRFDVVISNDVLEHLVNEQAAKRALRDLCFISKKWVLLSVGVLRSRIYSKILNLPIRDLHIVKGNDSWWEELVKRNIDIVWKSRIDTSLYFFGTKKDA